MALGQRFTTIMAAARTGAEWAWGEIYDDLAPIVLRYFRVRSAPDAEDLVSDVFVRVVGKLPDFAGSEAEFRAWVLTIAHNRLIDVARAKARRPVEPVPDDVLVRFAGAGNAEEDWLGALATERVRAVIDGLSPDQRDVLLLRIIGQLSLEETAALLGKKVGAVKALQSRGVAAIRRGIAREAVSL